MSLKSQNVPLLGLIIAINTLLLCGLIEGQSITGQSLQAMTHNATNLFPVGLGLIVTTVCNGLLPRSAKERLVFLRWHHALPGHRAFSEHAVDNPTVDAARLQEVCGGVLPNEPLKQNQTWYRLYKMVEKDAAVVQTHRSYLLTRDYTGLAFLFFVFYGSIAMYAVRSWAAFFIYIAMLGLQFFLARMAAENYATNFVRTVLSRACL